MRSARVEMILDTYRAVKGAKDLSKSVGEVADNMTAADKAGTKAGKAIDQAGDDMSEAARAAATLDRQVEELTGSLRQMATAQALGGGDFTKQIRQQEAQLRRLTRDQKLINFDKAAEPAALGFFAKFSGRLGPLMGSLPISGPLGAVLAGAGAAGAPVFVSALASGISAGAGAGVLGAGIALAFKQDEKLAETGKRFGDQFMQSLSGAVVSARSRDEITKSLAIVLNAGDDFSAKFGATFDRLRPKIVPLTHDIVAGMQSVTDASLQAAAESGPALDSLGGSVRLVGDGIGDLIRTVSDGGPAAAENLRLIAGATADLAKWTGNTLNFLNKLSTNEFLAGPLLNILRTHYAEAAEEATHFAESNRRLKEPLDNAARAANGQRSALSELSKEMQAQTDPAFALLRSQDQLREAQRKATAAVKDHGRNSTVARQATRGLALAAIDLQAKTGALGSTFAGKLTPQMRATLIAARLTGPQIKNVERELIRAKSAADKYDGKYVASVTVVGDAIARQKLRALNIQQNALRKGVSISAGAARALAGDEKAARDRGVFDGGGWTGPGPKMQEAGIVHADEWVIQKKSTRKLEQKHPGLLDYQNKYGELPPGYAGGGRVAWPFRTTAAMTRIPSAAEVLARVIPAGPTGGATAPFMERLLEARFNRAMISGFRRGSRTLSGNLSYHALNRAVDFPPVKAMAAFMYNNYKSRLKEAITPWQQYNVHNGRNHRYTGAVWRQHAFGYGNAHNHFAMYKGGTIREPVLGYGLRSGSTYSLAERGPERVHPTGTGGGVTMGPFYFTINGTDKSPREIAAEVDRKVGATAELLSRAG